MLSFWSITCLYNKINWWSLSMFKCSKTLTNNIYQKSTTTMLHIHLLNTQWWFYYGRDHHWPLSLISVHHILLYYPIWYHYIQLLVLSAKPSLQFRTTIAYIICHTSPMKSLSSSCPLDLPTLSPCPLIIMVACLYSDKYEEHAIQHTFDNFITTAHTLYIWMQDDILRKRTNKLPRISFNLFWQVIPKLMIPQDTSLSMHVRAWTRAWITQWQGIMTPSSAFQPTCHTRNISASILFLLLRRHCSSQTIWNRRHSEV